MYPQPRTVKCGAELRQRVRWEAVSWLAPVSSCFLWPAGPDAAGSLSTQPGSGVLGQRSSAEYLEAWRWAHLTVLFCSTVSAGGSGPRHVGQRAVQNKCYETLPRRNHFSCLPERIVGVCSRCPNLQWSIEIASPPTESSGSLGLTNCCSWTEEWSFTVFQSVWDDAFKFQTRCPGQLRSWNMCIVEPLPQAACVWSEHPWVLRLGSAQSEKVQNGAIIFCIWLSERKLDNFSGRNVSLPQARLYSLSFPPKSLIELGFHCSLIFSFF